MHQKVTVSTRLQLPRSVGACHDLEASIYKDHKHLGVIEFLNL